MRPDPVPPPPWLEDVRARLTAECARPPSRTALAAAAGVDPAHMSRAFRLHYGVTMTGFARECRVALAMELLARTDASVEDVAHQAGFSDQGHLARELRRRTGMTPAAWRRARWAREVAARSALVARAS